MEALFTFWDEFNAAGSAFAPWVRIQCFDCQTLHSSYTIFKVCKRDVLKPVTPQDLQSAVQIAVPAGRAFASWVYIALGLQGRLESFKPR